MVIRFSPIRIKQIMKYSEKQIKDIINLIIMESMGLEIEDILPEKKIKDELGFDSIDEVELIINIETDFDINISEKEGSKYKIVNDIYESVITKVKNK